MHLQALSREIKVPGTPYFRVVGFSHGFSDTPPRVARTGTNAGGTHTLVSLPRRDNEVKTLNSCIYCGNPGHYLPHCLFWGKQERPPVKRDILVGIATLSPSYRLTLPTVLQLNQNRLPVSALKDSGTEQNLISMDLVTKLSLPTQENPPFSITVVTNETLAQIRLTTTDLHLIILEITMKIMILSYLSLLQLS